MFRAWLLFNHLANKFSGAGAVGAIKMKKQKGLGRAQGQRGGTRHKKGQNQIAMSETTEPEGGHRRDVGTSYVPPG